MYKKYYYFQLSNSLYDVYIRYKCYIEKNFSWFQAKVSLGSFVRCYIQLCNFVEKQNHKLTIFLTQGEIAGPKLPDIL